MLYLGRRAAVVPLADGEEEADADHAVRRLRAHQRRPEAYRTLENNLKKAKFKAEHSFRWKRYVDGVTVILEFLCETDQVDAGQIFRPKQGMGSGLGAFNVRGAQLVTRDYFECEIEADRLDNGGRSRVIVRVANILSYTVLKILAFQDRHENKDSYDLVYCLLNSRTVPGMLAALRLRAQSTLTSRLTTRCGCSPNDSRRSNRTVRMPTPPSSPSRATMRRRRGSARRRWLWSAPFWQQCREVPPQFRFVV